MAQSIIHTSFAGGELSPNLFARVDLDKYHVGAQLMRNFFVDYRGGASTRPGTRFISRGASTNTIRLIPFVVAQIQSYVCEFGDHYIRFYANGAQLTEAPVTITGITQAFIAVVTAPAHGYSSGQEIFINGVLGMTQVNGKNFGVTVLTPNTFQIYDLDGNYINSTGYTAYASGGTASRIYTVASPYAFAELRLLKFVQSADVLTLTHPAHMPYDLIRSGPNTFSLIAKTFGAAIGAPVGFGVTPVTAGAYHYGYTVTAVSSSGEESLESVGAVATSVILDQTTGKVVSLTWTAVAGAVAYNVYKWGPIPVALADNTVGGYIGTALTNSFVDNNIGPDFSQTAPQAYNPIAGNNPGCSTYFQQRLCYGNFLTNPEAGAMSKVGAYNNFNRSLIPLASDSILFSLASRQVNAIQFMVPMSSGLVAFTTGGAFLISGGGAAFAAVTPENVTAQPQASPGCNDHVPPIVVNYDIYFVQAKGSNVRDLAYNFYANTYYGTDRSSLASHLFFGYQINEWAYGEEPFKLIWAIRNDGILLCFTVVPEQEVFGWSRHDTDGIFESICTVPEGDEDAIYFVISRTIGGVAKKYIERLASRNFFGDVARAWCVDCGLEYSGAPVTSVTNLDHLVGKTVSILADGQVLPSQVVPEGGTLSFPNAANRIIVGLPFLPQLQTLRLDVGEPTIQGRRKMIPAVTARVDQTRGLKFGIDFDRMDEPPEMQIAYTPPMELVTGDLRLPVPTDWRTEGQICVQQDYPLPATVLGLIPEVVFGDTGR